MSQSSTGLLLRQAFLAEAHGAKPIRVVGIDLGTTNSTVSEVDYSADDFSGPPPACRPLEIEQSTRDGVYISPLVPSVVAILPNGAYWVGEGAKRLRARPQEANLVLEKTLFFDAKNDMGRRKTYYRAAEPYDCAWKISAHVLRFLLQSAKQAADRDLNRVIVTVPASFQVNQRRDTLFAAEQAGLRIQDHDLLDEPIAALMDFLVHESGEGLFRAGSTSRVLVFDFGGGTCDVSIVEIGRDTAGRQLTGAMISASRYHRLGGGDLDAAIVHEHLIPALLLENNLPRPDLTFTEKKKGLEPQLLGTAEALKIALCKEIDRLEKFGMYEGASKSEVVARQPSITCQIGNRQFALSQPRLSATDWEAILEPFLDSDHLYARDTEYRLVQSIFAPLQDALDRAKLAPRQVDLVLLVGGSTLIPQVRRAVRGYFTQSHVRAFEDALDVQVAVSRGAAWHAFFREVTGKPFIQPVSVDGIALMTEGGEPYTLIPAGTTLPYPPDGGYASLSKFGVPAAFASELRMQVVTLSHHQSLLDERWGLQGTIVNAGDPITVEFRLGANQDFECRAFLTNSPEIEFSRTVLNPLVNTVNPNSTHVQMEEIEEELRQQGGPGVRDREKLVTLARLNAELRRHEKGLDYLRMAMRLNNRPDSELLNLEGMYHGELRDYEREMRAYKEADRAATRWGGPMFNLSLSFLRQKRASEALEAIEAAIQKESQSAPYHTQKGRILRECGRGEEGDRVFREAIGMYGSLQGLSDWEAGWFERCAFELKDAEAISKAQVEQSRRRNLPTAPEETPGMRPRVLEGLDRRPA